VRDDPDCLESRPPAVVSAWSSMLKDGIGGLRMPPEAAFDSECALAWEEGIGGKSLVGAAEAGSVIFVDAMRRFLEPRCCVVEPAVYAIA
jgi:hypothetical protein